MGQALDDRKAESLHQRWINGERAFCIGCVHGRVAHRSIIAELPSGRLQRVKFGNRGGARLRMREPDQVQLKTFAALPELFAGLQQREVILASLDAPNRQHNRGALGWGGFTDRWGTLGINPQWDRCDWRMFFHAEPAPIFHQG